MAVRRTEQLHRKAEGLDLQPDSAILAVLAEGQIEAAQSVHGAVDAIAEGAALCARALSGGGRLVYAAAGSSGLMALADALELPGTYGIARDKIVVLLAGGTASLQDLAGGPEDDAAQAVKDLAVAGVAAGDCLIALSASGSTPYAVGAVEEARRRGLSTIGIANNPDTPLGSASDVGIVLATPPEVIAGSTRMGAGTAQKIALNMLSTLVAVHLGHVHDGHMVNLRADNIKLKGRAVRIVAAITGVEEDLAARALDQAGGAVKPAILIAAGAAGVRHAQELLDQGGGRVRAALMALEDEGTRPLKHGT